jgi:hypothetical protein
MEITIKLTDEQIERYTVARDYLFLGHKIPPHVADIQAYLTDVAATAVSDAMRWMENIAQQLKDEGE